MKETFISADIGGTNTRLRIFEIRSHDPSIRASPKSTIGQEAPGLLLLKKSYQNQDYSSFGEVVRAFLLEAAVSKPPVSACLAVAGPVKNNVVRFTNRDSWEIDGDQIGEELGIKKVFLINDFVAAGYGVLTLNIAKECITLQKATKQTSAPIACIGAGTGLGQCYLTPSGDHGESGDYKCFPSEGGHSEFAPRNDLEFGLLTFLKERFQQPHRVSVERIVSGTGLSNVYDYLCALYPHKVDERITEMMAAAGDNRGAVIATNPQNELCKKTMELFVTAYGAEAGVAALKWLPYGGLYLCGGLTPKNIDLIKDPKGDFMTAMMDKGRVQSMLSQIPVYAVMVEDLGERGAHYMAYKEFCKEMYVPVQAEKVPVYVGTGVECDKPDSMPISAASYSLRSSSDSDGGHVGHNGHRKEKSLKHESMKNCSKESKRSLNHNRVFKYFRLKKQNPEGGMKEYDVEQDSASSVWVKGYENTTITIISISVLSAFILGGLSARLRQ